MVNDLALSRDTFLNSSIIAMLLGAKTFVTTYDMSLLLRTHLRIHNQRANTGMYSLDFLKHLCTINLLCHSEPPLDCARCRDGTWLEGTMTRLQSASGPNGQLISTLRLAGLVRIYRAFDLFQLDGLKESQLQDLESLRSHHNVSPSNANWILVSTPTRTSRHFDSNRRIKLFIYFVGLINQNDQWNDAGGFSISICAGLFEDAT